MNNQAFPWNLFGSLGTQTSSLGLQKGAGGGGDRGGGMIKMPIKIKII